MKIRHLDKSLLLKKTITDNRRNCSDCIICIKKVKIIDYDF